MNQLQAIFKLNIKLIRITLICRVKALLTLKIVIINLINKTLLKAHIIKINQRKNNKAQKFSQNKKKSEVKIFVTGGLIIMNQIKTRHCLRLQMIIIFKKNIT